MKKGMTMGMILAAVQLLAGSAWAAEKALQKVVALANTELVELGTDAVIVEAVQAENAKGKTLDQIKALDQKWQTTAGVVDFMKALMDSPCGERLKAIKKSAPCYMEIFVMDNLGANVCMSEKTSDYWQGDEPKFTESYKGGAGAVHISDVKFDDSTQVHAIQVSVPVKDSGETIGAMTFGIDLDKLQ